MASAKEDTLGNRPPAKRSLYAEHKKVYPRVLSSGRFRRVKWIAMAVLLAVYWIGPWLRWDRGSGAPDQAILIDLPGRRAYFFFIEIWPQEVYYLTGLLIIAALTLFFLSSLLGRVWCGFACWQTQFTDLFVWIEEKIEGDRITRMQLDQAPMSIRKLARKTLKHLCWVLVAVAFGGNFVLFFENAPNALRDIASGQASIAMLTAMGVLSFMCYLLAGYAREQVCIYMCPYARFQSAMFDEHSLIVSYEAWRGEPRGPLRGKVAGRPAEEIFAGRGHCVDCRMCVQVCPTGIDIRNGSQLACIGCALCVDACNATMDRLGLPRGLISYDSSYNQVARSKGEAARTRLIRPRTLLYLAVIALVCSVMAFGLATRQVFDVTVLHERAPLFSELSGQRLRNGYTIRVLNKERDLHHFAIVIEGLPEATMSAVGVDGEGVKEIKIPVAGDSVGTFRLFLTAPKAAIRQSSVPITVVVTDLEGGRSVQHANIFAGPEHR